MNERIISFSLDCNWFFFLLYTGGSRILVKKFWFIDTCQWTGETPYFESLDGYLEVIHLWCVQWWANPAMFKSKSKSKSKSGPIFKSKSKSKSTNPDLKIRLAHYGQGGFVDLKFSNPNPAMFKSNPNPNPPLRKKLKSKSKSTVPKKLKSNPNPNPLDLAKVVKSGFKSKSGFGFAHHWVRYMFITSQ